MEVQASKPICPLKGSDKISKTEIPTDSMLMALYVMLLLVKTSQNSLLLHQKELHYNQQKKLDVMHALSEKSVWTIEPLEKVEEDEMQQISTYNALKSAESQTLENKISILNQAFSIESSQAGADGQGATQMMGEFSSLTASLKNLTDKIMR